MGFCCFFHRKIFVGGLAKETNLGELSFNGFLSLFLSLFVWVWVAFNLTETC